MITIERFTNAADAYATKKLLEDNQISCELEGDFDATEIDRIRLNIRHEKDLELARDLIANAINNKDR
jgi:hypothetical protein